VLFVVIVAKLRLQQVFRLGRVVEPIVFVEDRGDVRSVFRSEVSLRPIGEEVGLGSLIPGANVPGHAEKELHVDGGFLEAADVEYPDGARALIVGFAHLLPDQGRRRGAEPEVIFRSAQ